MHKQLMQIALQQAWLKRGLTAPNPAVGAVAVADGNIIAQASHLGAGQPHAEQLLFQCLPDDCSNISLYVTLEPCNHWGKTPPCVDGIISRRFKRVVYGYTDPNPLVAVRNTPHRLRTAGIEVIHCPLPEIDAFYESYAFWSKTGRPWVTIKIAQTFDGKIAGKDGARMNLSNPSCSLVTHQGRLHTDVILTTTRTILQDDPQLNARVGSEVISKPVAILGRQQLKRTATIYQTAKKIHFYEDMKLTEVLDDLGRIGYHDVWVEAGAKLFNAFHREQLVQKTLIYLVPNSLGSDATSLYLEKDILLGAKKINWEPLEDNLKVTLEWS